MESFISKYNYQRPAYTPHKLERSIDEITADINEYETIKNTPKDFIYQYGSASSIAANLPEKNNNLYDVSEVRDQRVIGLSTINLTKVELSLGVSADSTTVATAINKQVLNVIGNTLKTFNLKDPLNSSIKTYTEGNMLEQANSLINKGALAIIQKGGSAKALDDYLYTVSANINKSIQDIKNTFGDEIIIKKDEVFGLETSPTLRVWQEKDVMVNVVSQTFNITNSDGDIVEINASFSNSKSQKTDNYSNTNKILNVEITKGSLDQNEQAAFNQFLDDFASVTNAILKGDENLANEAYDKINPLNYGFQSIKKVRENTYQRYDNEEALHIYNEDLGHNGSGGVIGRFSGTYQDQSYIKGGEFNGLYRNSVEDLSEFDIKFANTYAQPSSGITTPVTRQTYDFSQKDTALSGLSQQYGKYADGLIMQNDSGQLFRFEYNAKDRGSSGWREFNSESIQLESLKTKQYFEQYKLEIIKETGQVLLKEDSSGKIITADTKFTTQKNSNQYGQAELLDQSVFEDKSGNLYQYVKGDNYNESGWLQIENTIENRVLMELRQQKEDLHQYLTIDKNTKEVNFTSMINSTEIIDTYKDLYTNMKILTS